MYEEIGANIIYKLFFCFVYKSSLDFVCKVQRKSFVLQTKYGLIICLHRFVHNKKKKVSFVRRTFRVCSQKGFLDALIILRFPEICSSHGFMPPVYRNYAFLLLEQKSMQLLFLWKSFEKNAVVMELFDLICHKKKIQCRHKTSVLFSQG